MLDILRSIVQEVNAARNLDQALTIIVQRVKSAQAADVCSIYLFDPDRDELVLMASDGLLPDSVGKVRLRFEQGLVGLVAQRAEPVNIENAPDHPRYHYFPETAEERYHAFLGVPIIHHREVLGVLILQQSAAHKYSEDVVTFLVTIAAQLAGAIAHAEASGGIEALRHHRQVDGRPLTGLPGAPGVGIGQAVVVHPYEDIDSIPDRQVTDTETEQAAFLNAVQAVKTDVRQMIANMTGLLPKEEIALFDAYLMMLDSDSLIDAVKENIQNGNWAPGALRDVFSAHIRVFSEMEDAYLRERAEDLRDLGRRILLQLQETTQQNTEYSDQTILVGEEITASMLAEVPAEKLAAVVSVRGSSTSHTAILARALNIPAVLGVDDLPVRQIHGLEVIVDGYSGYVYINPSRQVRAEYQRLQKQELDLSENLRGMRDLEAATTDGVHIPLYANTGLLSDIAPSLNSGAEGVGLYRTEFPFMIREQFPGEEVQYHIYRQVLEAFKPNPVTMRTLDIGGDKALPYFPIDEDNPFLGWRGIRITLDHPEIFLTQLRAMLRANVGMNNLRLLLPMISTVSEVDEAMVLIHQAYNELVEDGEPVQLPEIGVMVEVPSAVYLIDKLAQRVDFLSVGSNDLTQYLLAVDRNNARVAKLYDALHPAVIQALKLVVEASKKQAIPVSVCGEMAGDPMAVIVLLGLGINSLSMNASSLPRIKWLIRNLSCQQARQHLKHIMEMDDPTAIRRYLGQVLEQVGLGGLVRAGN